jgi:hypothetical protein
MNEQQVIDLLNETSKYTFKKEKDNFSRYDAFCEEHGVMLEIKCRILSTLTITAISLSMLLVCLRMVRKLSTYSILIN